MLFLQSAPHPSLNRYIGQYNYVSFNTALLPSLKQTFLPYDIPAISVFIGPVFLEHAKQSVTGPIATTKSQPTFAYFNALITGPFSLFFPENANISVFVIPFKPSGFSALFNRDMAELTNNLPNLSALVGASESDRFLDQLLTAKEFQAQITVLDQFFLKKIAPQSLVVEQIREACHQLILADGQMKMKELAFHTNMSLRTLERQFTERIGVSPKLFARFKRLHKALALMNRPLPPTWIDIAYQCGYYDQAHFIREFKTFSDQSPSAYCPEEYLLYNQIILSRNFASF